MIMIGGFVEKPESSDRNSRILVMFQKNFGIIILNLTLGADDSWAKPGNVSLLRGFCDPSQFFTIPEMRRASSNIHLRKDFGTFVLQSTSSNTGFLNWIVCYKPYQSNRQSTVISRNCCMICWINELMHDLWRRGLGNLVRETSKQTQRHLDSLPVGLGGRSYVVQWSHSNTTHVIHWSNKELSFTLNSNICPLILLNTLGLSCLSPWIASAESGFPP